MAANRLGPVELADYLDGVPPGDLRTVRALRRAVLRAAPGVAEGVKFHSLCYWVRNAPFGAIGGNVCMIQARRGGAGERGGVWLSFIQGAGLADPAGLLEGKGKAMRRVAVESVERCADAHLAALVRRSARAARRGAAAGRAEAVGGVMMEMSEARQRGVSRRGQDRRKVQPERSTV